MHSEFLTLNLEDVNTLTEAERAVCPRVEAAAALVLWSGRILAAFNENWSAFTLPITKRIVREGGRTGTDAAIAEAWEVTSRRAAEECLQRPVPEHPTPVLDLREFLASGRDHIIKRYHIRVFRFDIAAPDAPQGQGAKWMHADALLRPGETWVSPTAKHIIGELRDAGYRFG
jgi:hypothetical protein